MVLFATEFLNLILTSGNVNFTQESKYKDT